MIFIYDVVCDSYLFQERLSSHDVGALLYLAYRLQKRILMSETKLVVTQ